METIRRIYLNIRYNRKNNVKIMSERQWQKYTCNSTRKLNIVID